MGAGRRHRPRRAPARRCPLPRQSPSLLVGKSFGVFRERKRWSARLTRQPGCRPATRKTKLTVVSAPKNRVCLCQSRVSPPAGFSGAVGSVGSVGAGSGSGVGSGVGSGSGSGSGVGFGSGVGSGFSGSVGSVGSVGSIGSAGSAGSAGVGSGVGVGSDFTGAEGRAGVPGSGFGSQRLCGSGSVGSQPRRTVSPLIFSIAGVPSGPG